MGFSAIIKQVMGAGQNLWNLVGSSDTPYDSNIALDASNTEVVESDRAWQSSLGYGFKVVRVDRDGGVNDADNWEEFTLQINPQDITQDEIFAIQVTPTFSGVMVEHQGVTLKDITISGTTGISPGRRAGGAYPTTGAAVAGAGRSGYFEFHELRTYIRTYAEAKRNDQDDSAGELRLIWRNYKDKEDLYVEPQKFTMKRSSAKPFSYDYVIQLKAIGIASFDENKGWMGYVEKLDKVIQGVTDTITTFTKVLQGGIGLLETIQQDAENTILAPLREVNKFLSEYQKAGKRLEVLKRKRIKAFGKAEMTALRDHIREVTDNGNDALGVDTAAYNTMKGRTATLAPVTTETMTYSQAKVINALKKVQNALNRILVQNAIFESTINRQATDISDTYNYAAKNASKAANADEKASLALEKTQAELAGNVRLATQLQKQLDDLVRSEANNRVSSRSVSFINSKYTTTKIVEAGHTIQTLALKYLNDVDAYRDLVLINNLRPPYVNPFPENNTIGDDYNPRVNGVLMPGDIIYIPQTGSPKKQTSVATAPGYPITFGQDLYELKYGVDIKMTDSFDIDLDVTGDAKLISGQDNVGQALVLKLLYEKSSLKRHPSIGTSLGIGLRFSDVRSLISEVRRSLISDSRVDAILASEVVREDNAVLINAMIRLTGSDQPVAFPVRIQE